MLRDVDGTDCKHSNVLHHKVYNGKFRIALFKLYPCLAFAMQNDQKCYIPLTIANIQEIIMVSAMNFSLEGQLFYNSLSEWEGIGNSGFGKLDTLKRHYSTKRFRFVKFLEEHRKNFVQGTAIENARFVKFFFDEEPANIEYSDWGRTYINYRQQLANGSVISDIQSGSGLSAGYLDKVFMYFGSCHAYGERLFVLRPIKSEHYRLNDYECLGDKFAVERELTLTDADSIRFLLSQMSDEAKESFFRCDRGHSIKHSYGQIDSTINQMKDLAPDRYADAIRFLEELYTLQTDVPVITAKNAVQLN